MVETQIRVLFQTDDGPPVEVATVTAVDPDEWPYQLAHVLAELAEEVIENSGAQPEDWSVQWPSA